MDAAEPTPDSRDRGARAAADGVPVWFLLVLAAGAALRLLLVVASEGSYDVGTWASFARSVHGEGLIASYHALPKLNHPPAVTTAVAPLWALAEATGIPFRVWFRLPFAALDALTAALMLDLLRARRGRFGWVAAYWLLPLAPLFSAQHGNTDSAIGCLLVLCLWLRSRGRPDAAAAVIGIATWVKLPVLVGMPALFFALPSARERARFAAIAAATALAGYLPALAADPVIVVQRVLLYGGQIVRTTGGVLVWGIQVFYPGLAALPAPGRALAAQLIHAHYLHNGAICVVLIVVYAWLRRREIRPLEVARSVALSYAILYGVSNFWSFQYFAWSLPLWILAGPVFGGLSVALATAYVYGLYAWLTGDPLLLGPWDFLGHPEWPAPLRWARDANVIFFLGAALGALSGAVLAESRYWRRRLRHGRA